MRYENFDKVQELCKEIKTLESKLLSYTSTSVSVTISVGGTDNKESVWPFYGDSDGSLFDKEAKQMLKNLARETEYEIGNLKAELETL